MHGADDPKDANGHEEAKTDAERIDSILSDAATRGHIRHSELRDAVGNPTQRVVSPVIAMPPKYATFRVGEPLDAIGNDTAKPTPSVVTPFVAMSEQNARFGMYEPIDAIRHDVGKLDAKRRDAYHRDASKGRHVATVFHVATVAQGHYGGSPL
jgi:hypothetical protein